MWVCVALVAACAQVDPTPDPAAQLYPNETPELRQLINEAAAENEVPVALVQRVIIRESTHQPEARNGPYYGLMQILPATARSMGFRGKPSELLDAQTNLRYATRYLRGAWLVSDGDMDRAVMWYARGYYYEAKSVDWCRKLAWMGARTGQVSPPLHACLSAPDHFGLAHDHLSLFDGRNVDQSAFVHCCAFAVRFGGIHCGEDFARFGHGLLRGGEHLV